MNLIEKIKEFLFGKKEKKFYRYKSKPIYPKKYNAGPVESGKTSKKLKKSKQAPRLVQPERGSGHSLVGKEATTHTPEFKKIFNDKQSEMLHKELMRAFNKDRISDGPVGFNLESFVKIPVTPNLNSRLEDKEEVIEEVSSRIYNPALRDDNFEFRADVVRGRKPFLEMYYGKSYVENLDRSEIDNAYCKLLATYYVESELDRYRRRGFSV